MVLKISHSSASLDYQPRCFGIFWWMLGSMTFFTISNCLVTNFDAVRWQLWTDAWSLLANNDFAQLENGGFCCECRTSPSIPFALTFWSLSSLKSLYEEPAPIAAFNTKGLVTRRAVGCFGEVVSCRILCVCESLFSRASQFDASPGTSAQILLDTKRTELYSEKLMTMVMWQWPQRSHMHEESSPKMRCREWKRVVTIRNNRSNCS